ncbi:hypothetical protein KR018_011906 [Drosophila ironensis]|nr:hypothetical protein KR018_011906 [Drosophila ironensis]
MSHNLAHQNQEDNEEMATQQQTKELLVQQTDSMNTSIPMAIAGASVPYQSGGHCCRLNVSWRTRRIRRRPQNLNKIMSTIAEPSTLQGRQEVNQEVAAALPWTQQLLVEENASRSTSNPLASADVLSLRVSGDHHCSLNAGWKCRTVHTVAVQDQGAVKEVLVFEQPDSSCQSLLIEGASLGRPSDEHRWQINVGWKERRYHRYHWKYNSFTVYISEMDREIINQLESQKLRYYESAFLNLLFSAPQCNLNVGWKERLYHRYQWMYYSFTVCIRNVEREELLYIEDAESRNISSVGQCYISVGCKKRRDHKYHWKNYSYTVFFSDKDREVIEQLNTQKHLYFENSLPSTHYSVGQCHLFGGWMERRHQRYHWKYDAFTVHTGEPVKPFSSSLMEDQEESHHLNYFGFPPLQLHLRSSSLGQMDPRNYYPLEQDLNDSLAPKSPSQLQPVSDLGTSRDMDPATYPYPRYMLPSRQDTITEIKQIFQRLDSMGEEMISKLERGLYDGIRKIGMCGHLTSGVNMDEYTWQPQQSQPQQIWPWLNLNPDLSCSSQGQAQTYSASPFDVNQYQNFPIYCNPDANLQPESLPCLDIYFSENTVTPSYYPTPSTHSYSQPKNFDCNCQQYTNTRNPNYQSTSNISQYLQNQNVDHFVGGDGRDIPVVKSPEKELITLFRRDFREPSSSDGIDTRTGRLYHRKVDDSYYKRMGIDFNPNASSTPTPTDSQSPNLWGTGVPMSGNSEPVSDPGNNNNNNPGNNVDDFEWQNTSKGNDNEDQEEGKKDLKETNEKPTKTRAMIDRAIPKVDSHGWVLFGDEGKKTNTENPFQLLAKEDC